MNYSNIIQYDTANGPGIRTSLFVSGCKNHCVGCFNNEAHDFNCGTPFTDKTYKQIQEHLQSPVVAGLSLLGGDPLWQNIYDITTLINLCQYTHKLNKNVWLWTGFSWEDVIDLSDDSMEHIYRRALLRECDVVVDGPFIESLKDLSLAWRGSSNQRIIDVQKSLEHHCAIRAQW